MVQTPDVKRVSKGTPLSRKMLLQREKDLTVMKAVGSQVAEVIDFCFPFHRLAFLQHILDNRTNKSCRRSVSEEEL